MSFKETVRTLFGEPRQGIHKLRIPILDIALVDELMTLLAAAVISQNYDISFIKTTVGLHLLGLFLHGIFGVKSRLTFPQP